MVTDLSCNGHTIWGGKIPAPVSLIVITNNHFGSLICFVFLSNGLKSGLECRNIPYFPDRLLFFMLREVCLRTRIGSLRRLNVFPDRPCLEKGLFCATLRTRSRVAQKGDGEGEAGNVWLSGRQPGEGSISLQKACSLQVGQLQKSFSTHNLPANLLQCLAPTADRKGGGKKKEKRLLFKTSLSNY